MYTPMEEVGGMMKKRSSQHVPCSINNGVQKSNTRTIKPSPRGVQHKMMMMMMMKMISKPKIRIIHIFEPEIIKTDVANFRELVQQLTGKPTTNNFKKKQQKRVLTSLISDHDDNQISSPTTTTTTTTTTSSSTCSRGPGKKLEDLWVGADTGGGFLDGFADLEYGFMQDLTGFHMETPPHHLDCIN